MFLVAGSYESPHEIQRIYSQRVRGADGVLLDPAPPVVGANHARYPRVAAFSDRWVVVWQRHPTHDNPNATPKANIVLASGLHQAEFSLSSEGKFPAVAVGESHALAAWDQRNGTTIEDRDIFARRLLPTGGFAEGAPFLVTSAANAQFDAAVGWTGTEFVTAFGDFRKDPQYASKAGDLFGARISADGVVLDPESFVISDLAVPEMFAASAGGGGGVLLGGSIFREETGQGSFRIGVRVNPAAAGVPQVAVAPVVRTLQPAWPNPFRATTRVAFELPAAGAVQVRIHDAAGRLVRVFPETFAEAGTHAVTWDGRDDAGRAAAQGVYFLTLDGNVSGGSQRLVLIR